MLPFFPGSYSLSIRDLDHNSGEGVKHYRIRNMDNGGFYITAKISFNSLKELVQHHSRMCGLSRDWIIDDKGGLHWFSLISAFQVIQMACARSWWSHVSPELRRSPGGRMSGRSPVSPWSWSADLERDSLEKSGWVSGTKKMRGGVVTKVKVFVLCFRHRGLNRFVQIHLHRPVPQLRCGFDCMSAGGPFTRSFVQRMQNSFLQAAFNCRLVLVNCRITYEVIIPVMKYHPDSMDLQFLDARLHECLLSLRTIKLNRKAKCLDQEGIGWNHVRHCTLTRFQTKQLHQSSPLV